MPDIEIVKLKIRRGTDVQRKAVVLEQGELGYTTDTKRLWIGDGALAGGNITGNIIHPPLSINTRTSLDSATTGDLVYENRFLYQLSGTDYSKLSSWGFIGTSPETTSINYNAENRLFIVDNAISAKNLNQDAVYQSGGIGLNPTLGLSANVDDNTLTVNTTTNQLSVLTIDEQHIASSSLGNGLVGGDGTVISIDATNTFTFDNGELELSLAPASTVNAASFTSETAGNGLTVTGNVLALTNIGDGITRSLDKITYDVTGRVTNKVTSIVQNVSGTGTTTPTGSAYKGYLDQFPEADYSGNALVTTLSTNPAGATATATLSSAGFIQFDAGGALGTVAVPVFKLPY